MNVFYISKLVTQKIIKKELKFTYKQYIGTIPCFALGVICDSRAVYVIPPVYLRQISYKAYGHRNPPTPPPSLPTHIHNQNKHNFENLWFRASAVRKEKRGRIIVLLLGYNAFRVDNTANCCLTT